MAKDAKKEPKQAEEAAPKASVQPDDQAPSPEGADAPPAAEGQEGEAPPELTDEDQAWALVRGLSSVQAWLVHQRDLADGVQPLRSVSVPGMIPTEAALHGFVDGQGITATGRLLLAWIEGQPQQGPSAA